MVYQPEIRGFIIRILSPTEFLIDKGTNHGVKRGTKFKIVAKEIDVNDFDNKYLGTFYYPSGEIFATEIFENYTYCRTGTITEFEEEEPPSLKQTTNRRRKVKTRQQIELNVKDPLFHFFQPEIKVGDLVIEVK